MSDSETDGPKLSLDQISTRWTAIQDPMQFTLRYAEAIQRYIHALVRHPQDSEDVTQDFLTRSIRLGFPELNPDRGRFRDYLKRAARNAALTHLRKRRSEPLRADDEPIVDATQEAEADREWIAKWRQCLLDKVWRSLDHQEHQHPDNHACTVLRIWLEDESLDSGELAARVSARLRKDISPEAFRKQLSRARRQFGELLIEEVKQTLEVPSRERLEEELAELDLLSVLRRFLPNP